MCYTIMDILPMAWLLVCCATGTVLGGADGYGEEKDAHTLRYKCFLKHNSSIAG